MLLKYDSYSLQLLSLTAVSYNSVYIHQNLYARYIIATSIFVLPFYFDLDYYTANTQKTEIFMD